MTIYELPTDIATECNLHPHTISCLPGERWWGGAVNDGSLMPFAASYACDLRSDLKGNQATPLLVSSKGRFIWCEDPFAFELDANGDRIVVTTDGPIVLERTSAGNLASAFRAASSRFFPAAGIHPAPLNFMAPQYNSWIEMQYEPTQAKVLRYADDILASGLPAGVLMVDDNWFVDHGDWRFNRERFPDPAAMVGRLHEQAFAVMLWVSPFISPDSSVFRELSRGGLLVRAANGSPAVRAWWNGYSALLDVGHPDAIDWMHAQLGRLTTEYRVDGFKFDAGDPEYIHKTDRTYGGLSPTEYCRAWGEIGLRYPRYNEYRACWGLAGRPLVQRLRDKRHTWGRDGLADIVPNGLAQGLAGYAFICPDMVGGGDIGSFTEPGFTLDQELLVRTLQCSALFPIVQFSIAPWRLLGDEYWGYCLRVIQTRQFLAPTILRLARSAALTGEPILRHLSYVYPDGNYECVRDQFLIGDEILVGPVTTKGAESRTIVFPPGMWLAESGETIVGPCATEVSAPISCLPWYRAAPGSDRGPAE